ncbi:hypothetical protein [uncultured Dokdonia sp.]|uniref:tetratricopeptide repeat protein n=1 Tax=uncultured Dokdonia sp. TaxID=575653 RepID=UPI00260D2239|nr:hypothetical protein [uncultured Dokdonia sp.]
MRGENAFPYIYLSTAHKGNRMYFKALDASIIATKVEPKLYSSWNSIGESYRLVGKYEKSLNAYKNSIDLMPYGFDAYTGRALTLLRLNQYGAAQANFLKAFTIDNNEFKLFLPKYLAELENHSAPFWIIRLYYEIFPVLLITNYKRNILLQAENESKEALLILTLIPDQTWTDNQKNRVAGIIHYQMGDPIISAIFFEQLLVNTKGKFFDMYYFLCSLKSFESLKQEEVNRITQLMESIDYKTWDHSQLYYAGHIYLLIGENDKAFFCFKSVNSENDHFLPALYMELYMANLLRKNPNSIDELVDKIYAKEKYFYEFGSGNLILDLYPEFIGNNYEIDWKAFRFKYIYYNEVLPAISVLLDYIENNPSHIFNQFVNEKEAINQQKVRKTFKRVDFYISNYDRMVDNLINNFSQEFEEELLLNTINYKKFNSLQFEDLCASLIDKFAKDKFNHLQQVIFWGLNQNKISKKTATYLLLYSIWIKEDVYTQIRNSKIVKGKITYTILVALIGSLFTNGFMGSLVTNLGFSATYPLYCKFIENFIKKPDSIVGYMNFKQDVLLFIEESQFKDKNSFSREFGDSILLT